MGYRFGGLFFAGLVVALSVVGRPSHAGTGLKAIRIATPLTQPLFVTHAPGDSHRLFIVEQTGRIKVRKNGVILPTPFLNVDSISAAGSERGLLGLAFHPDYATNGLFYIYYSDNSSNIAIARGSVSANPDVAELDLTRVMSIPHPLFTNHYGGWMAFGPDDYLYITTGDGGWTTTPPNDGPDPFNNAQTITNNLLGKVLRIDVDGDDFPADANKNYAIPPGNPFVNLIGDDEIWSYGLRNPWRCAFDSSTGDLYVADVGHSDWEEINFEPPTAPGGRNYGWKCMEGAHCTTYGGCTCDDPSFTAPIHEYNHGVGCSITGGEVYRGCSIPDLGGAYFFADFCSGSIWSMVYDPESGPPAITNRTTELDSPSFNIGSISSFGRDAAGEVYICDRGGEVFKIVPDVVTAITDSDPPADAIDARAPIDPTTGNRVGWSGVSVTFNQAIECATELDFFTVQLGGLGAVPPIDSVTQIGPQQVDIILTAPMNPKAWTVATYETGGGSIRLGVLPGDVNGNRVSEEADPAHLGDVLDGVEPSRPIWALDINRSGMITGADVLEAGDLLIGAGLYDIYLGASLP